jgi:hypothetical protein
VFCKSAIAAGAKIVSLEDTQGVASPISVRQLIKFLWMSIDDFRSRRCQLSFRASNDRGLALANSLSAVFGGCELVEASLAGVGAGVGTAPIEELALTLGDKQEEFGAKAGLDSVRLGELAKSLFGILGRPPSPDKPLIGRLSRQKRALRLQSSNARSEVVLVRAQTQYLQAESPRFKVLFSVRTKEGETELLGYGERIEEAVLMSVRYLPGAPEKIENVEISFCAGFLSCYAEIDGIAIERVGGVPEVCLLEMCLEVMRSRPGVPGPAASR